MLPAPPKRHVIIFDAETYYDKDYSLKKMPTPNYILDQRFELQIVATKVDDGPHTVVDGPDFGAWLSQFDPNVTTTVSFNSLFDNSILAWRYGFVPHTMIDVMGMVRALLGHEMKHGVSLKAVAEHLGLRNKGTALQNVMGMRRDEIIGRGLMPAFKEYALDDNIICEGAFHRLYGQFPWAERRLMDMVLRCCVEPRFLCDVKMLQEHLVDVQEAKAELLRAANNIDPKIIMSTPKFKAALEAKGVDVEMKISPTSGLETPCFARTDEFMETLQEHADPEIAAMAAARLGLKSTLEETRTMKLISIASLPWQGPVEKMANRALAQEFDPEFIASEHLTTAMMPIPLRYGGAHTHRLSGEWKLNFQNMPTVRGSKGKSKLRQSLIVREDERVVSCDLSQIEARISAWICGCTTLVEEFARKLDPYSKLATSIFGYPVDRKLKDALGNLVFPIEGFIGKTGILGLGFGAGKDKFDTMVTQSARKDGLDISKIYNRALGDKAVDAYRQRYWQIKRGWQILDGAVRNAWLTPYGSQTFGPVVISYGNVLLPSGLSLCYADPKQVLVPDERYSTVGGQVTAMRTEYRYRYGKTWHSLYGAKLLENIVQALARIVVMNAALRIRDRGKHTAYPKDYFFKLQAHDELVFVVHKSEVDSLKKVVIEEMRRPPSWGKDIPLDAELGEGASYGEAK